VAATAGLTATAGAGNRWAVHEPGSSNFDRKAEIVRRLQAGDRGSDIARDLGVTRQYVSLLKQRLASEGVDAVATPSQRGRPKDRPLSLVETEALRARLAGGRPGATGMTALWTQEEIIRWFRRTHARPLTIHQLRRFCTERGLRLAPASDPISWLPGEPVSESSIATTEVASASGLEEPPPRRRTRRPTSPDRLSEDEVEEMARANAEVARRLRESQQVAESVEEALAGTLRLGAKLGRNDPCPLDAAKKFKRCCGATGATRCFRMPGTGMPAPAGR
jgi:transposase